MSNKQTLPVFAHGQYPQNTTRLKIGDINLARHFNSKGSEGKRRKKNMKPALNSRCECRYSATHLEGTRRRWTGPEPGSYITDAKMSLMEISGNLQLLLIREPEGDETR